MRSYPRNSPQAAARLVVLALIADGHVCRSEVDALRRADVEARLGLAPGGLGTVLQTLCEDLLQGGSMLGTPGVDAALIDALVREVDDPALQRQVLDAVAAVVAADGHWAEAEQLVLDALRRCWPGLAGLPAEVQPA